MDIPKAPEEDEEEENKTLPYLFEKELIENRNKHIHVFKTFRGTKKMCAPIEGKFYARHEQKLPPLDKHLAAINIGATQIGRTQRNGFPRLESQVYGWFPEKSSWGSHYKMRDLNYIVAPKLRCDMTIFGERLCSERHTERPPFNGIRFIF